MLWLQRLHFTCSEMADTMKDEPKTDPAQQWVSAFSWTDRLIARFFPRFFKRYAPEEIKEQLAAYQAKKRKCRWTKKG